MTSREYWARREAEQLLHNLSDEADAARRLDAIYRDMLDACQKEIESFYGKYASTEGITLAEAKKRVSELDIEAYARKSKRYVADKNFSDRANEELRLYNLTMKVNRLELLKANLGLELLRGYDELDAFLEEILQGRTLDELRRQAGILGETVRNNAKAASAIINASFHNATFSDRIWSNQSLLKIELDRLLQSGLIQGKNPRALARELRKKFDSSRYNAERLMRTELARVQTEAQKQSFLRNGFEYYEFVANGGCCDLCSALDGKHFRVRDMTPGENAPPMHPNCRCSTAAWEDSEEYEAWLDFLSRGGSTEEWNQRGKAEWLKKSGKVLDNSGNNGKMKAGNIEVRKWYIKRVSEIPDGIDKTIPIEAQARQAFEARNRIRFEAREMMADETTRKKLDAERPNKSFEDLIESKMKRKNMTRDEAILDILETATKTNAAVNSELGIGGDRHV